jgi:rubredoxin
MSVPDRYDESHKIATGTKFDDIPDDWRRPYAVPAKRRFTG